MVTMVIVLVKQSDADQLSSQPLRRCLSFELSTENTAKATYKSNLLTARPYSDVTRIASTEC